MDKFKTFTEIVHNIVVALAAVIGGLWVLNRLKRERTDEAALEMTPTTTVSPLGAAPQTGLHLVLFTVQLTNKGKTKIEAASEYGESDYIFDDGVERLKYACSLQIRQIDDSQMPAIQSLDWFEGGPWQDVVLFRGGCEINVLLDYENPAYHDQKGRERLEFWMEPGETYRLGVPVVLSKGLYVAKLTFVGAEQDRDWVENAIDDTVSQRRSKSDTHQNFWSQIFGFSVPAVNAEKTSA